MIGAKGRRVQTPEGDGTVEWSKGLVFLVKLDSGGSKMFILSEVTLLS